LSEAGGDDEAGDGRCKSHGREELGEKRKMIYGIYL